MRSLFAILFIIIQSTWAEDPYRICATESIDETTCNSLARGGGLVKCVRVTDSAECAIKLHEGKADFGIFDADELLLAYQFFPDEFTPLAQLKHKDRLSEDFMFQTVVVVPADYNSNEGLTGLKKRGLCHPGFSHNQIWNDYVMKFVERKTFDYVCRPESSVGENEAENLKNFFGTACRPGEWVLEPSEDQRLKKKYPELCQLCDNQAECKYHNDQHRHTGALECLTSGRGGAAYVAYEYVHEYFNINSNSSDVTPRQAGFQFLCPNSALQPLTSSNPCAWIRQPWGLILSRSDKAEGLLRGLKEWLADTRRPPEGDWISSLDKILQTDSKVIFFSEGPSLRNYLVSGREVDLPTKSCGHELRWCTVNEVETNKCNWVAKEAALLGIEPKFSCIEQNSTVNCLRAISENQADIIAIDSNHGHLARKKYNLTTILYSDTMIEKSSEVIAIVKENAGNNIRSFEDIKGKYLCFPEYGGISWLSFINAARFNKIIPETCDFAKAVAKLVTSACTPGIKDENYSDVAWKETEILDTLCDICPTEKGNGSSCSASMNNEYFGDKGVLKCLAGHGDIGFIEAKNLRGHINGRRINESDYRVLCRNGSLASYTGFEVDDNCALSITIDSEVVGRRENSTIQTLDTTLALLKIEDWLGYRAYSRRAIRIYDSFTGYSDLLFKDSTVGLEPTSSTIKTVSAYKELFSKLDSCVSSSSAIYARLVTIFFTAFIAFFFIN